MTNPLGEPISLAEIRDRFNRDIQPLIDAKVYTLRIAATYAAPKIQADARTVIYEAIDKEGKVVARCHCYEDSKGKILASGKLDPKFIVHLGKPYRVKL